jgi:hypothetical protein
MSLSFRAQTSCSAASRTGFPRVVHAHQTSVAMQTQNLPIKTKKESAPDQVGALPAFRFYDATNKIIVFAARRTSS